MRQHHSLIYAWAALSCVACSLEQRAKPPGRQSLGTYKVVATPVASQPCALSDVATKIFSFDVTLSWNPDSAEAFLTLAGGYSRPATWDGQVFRSQTTEQRRFDECSACRTRVQEDVDLALLSMSQAAAAGGVCPQKPLQGGVPTPDEAQGITLPALTEGGLDVSLACGELRTRVLVENNPKNGMSCPTKCMTCRTAYELAGKRQ